MTPKTSRCNCFERWRNITPQSSSYAYIDIYTKTIWSFHQTQLNVSKNPCVRDLSPVLFMREPPVSSVWRKEVVEIFKCCFGDSFEISLYPGPIVLLCRSLSRYMFCKPSWQICYMDLSKYYMYFLTSILPQITKKVDQDWSLCDDETKHLKKVVELNHLIRLKNSMHGSVVLPIPFFHCPFFCSIGLERVMFF